MSQRPIMSHITRRLHGGATALAGALALTALSAASASAAAPSAVHFLVSPVGSTSSITLHGAAGRVLHGAVQVRNLSRRPTSVVLQPADIQNSSNGDADYVTTHPQQVGRWLHLARHKVRLGPHGARQITFAVRIPRRVTGGAHYSGIVAVNAADLAHHAAHNKSGKPGFTFYRISRQAIPVTIHLPGRLTRSLSLTSVKLIAEPIGAGLVLGLLPGGTELTEAAPVTLRVTRGARTILKSNGTLGQLFPGSALNYRIAWPGRPTPGSYHVVGQIRPVGSPVINIDQTIVFSAAKAKQLTQETPPVAGAPASGSAMPTWVWGALAAAAAGLGGLSFAVVKLARRPHSVV
jgi:hypothetical protein